MVFLPVLGFPRKSWFHVYCFQYGIRAKQQQNLRKHFRRSLDQTSRCRRHHGRRHEKISPTTSGIVDLHSGTTLVAVRATLRPESLSLAAICLPHRQPNLFYSLSVVQQSYPSGQSQPHTLPMLSDYGQPPQKLSDLFVCALLSVDPYL